ncbi:MAG: M48 family metallopeptidase, partial [Armatimonadota bacterium]
MMRHAWSIAAVFVLLQLVAAAQAGPVTGLAAAEIERFGEGKKKSWPDPRLDEVAARVVQASNKPNLKAKFRVLNVKAKNALASADRKVFVTQGLFDATSDDGLAFVVGHEVAHIERGHHKKTLLTNVAAALGVGLLSRGRSRDTRTGLALGAGYFTSKRSRSWEREADRWGIRWAYAAGYDPYGALEVFRLFKADGSKGSGLFGRLFADHPDVDVRMRLAKKQIRELTGEEPRAEEEQ